MTNLAYLTYDTTMLVSTLALILIALVGLKLSQCHDKCSIGSGGSGPGCSAGGAEGPRDSGPALAAGEDPGRSERFLWTL